MHLSSPAFEHSGSIPSEYTCDGEGVSLPLSIREVPAEARSLVLIMTDPDIPPQVRSSYGITEFDHWVVFNIPPEPQDVKRGERPSGVRGLSSSGEMEYAAPCPPQGEHRYFLSLYALDVTLELPEGATKDQILEEMNGHILSQTTLMGRYKRGA